MALKKTPNHWNDDGRVAPRSSKCAAATKASQNSSVRWPRACRKRAMVTYGCQKGANKDPEFSKKLHFLHYFAQGVVSTRFCYQIWKPFMPEMPTCLFTTIFQSPFGHGKLRFDCAGASGSRVDPDEKRTKLKKRRPANQHTSNVDFLRK